MSFTHDTEFAYALAPMAEAMANATPLVVGDVDSRHALREPIVWHADTAQAMPSDVTDHQKPRHRRGIPRSCSTHRRGAGPRRDPDALA
jgi:hypothetical protein